MRKRVGLVLSLLCFFLPLIAMAQSRAVASNPALWNLALEIGPIDGLTVAWHPAPREVSVPPGTLLQFRIRVPRSSPVAWNGAQEIQRNSAWSVAKCPATAPAAQVVTVLYRHTNGGLIEESTRIVPWEASRATWSLSALAARADDVTLDAEHLNESTMHYYFRPGSIATLRRIGADHYRTSTNRWLKLAVAVDPPGLAPLIEWFHDGQPLAPLGPEIELILFPARRHAISARIGGTSREITIDTYSTKISSHRRGDALPDWSEITFVASTHPAGFEHEVHWLASTKHGTASPSLGQGPEFTVEFRETFGGDGSRWLGVRADNAAVGFDQKGTRFRKVADTGTAIPGGFGTFTDFGGFSVGPSFRNGMVAFDATGSQGQQGIYVEAGGELAVVADKTTLIPGETVRFAGFGSPSTSEGNLAFRGFKPGGGEGIYAWIDGELRVVADTTVAFVCDPTTQCCPDPDCDPTTQSCPPTLTMFYSFARGHVAFCSQDGDGVVRLFADAGAANAVDVLACATTPIPGGAGTFTGFPPFEDLSEGRLAFVGFGAAGQEGVYKSTNPVVPRPGGTAPVEPVYVRVADTSTPIPDGDGAFASFGSVALDANGNVAFKGFDAAGNQGIYTDLGGLRRIADTSTPIPDGSGNFTSLGFGPFTGPSFSNGRIAFLGFGVGDQFGIYLDANGALHKVIAAGDGVDARIAENFLMSPDGLDGDHLAFQAFFTDGTQGIFVANLEAILPSF